MSRDPGRAAVAVHTGLLGRLNDLGVGGVQALEQMYRGRWGNKKKCIYTSFV